VSQNRCLHCDRPLAFLKRLTGDGEFCSKEHRKIYQREHNELALARLLEAQPSSSRRTERQPQEKAPPAVKPASAKQPPQRVPPPAGYLSEYPREAAAMSGLRFTGDPRFAAASPARKETKSGAKSAGSRGGQPKVALFQSEPLDPRSFGAIVRFPDKSSLRSPGPRLADTLPPYDFSIAVRRQPGSAGFVSEPPAGGLDSAAAVHAPGPQFKLHAAASGPADVVPGIGCDPKLRCATFLPEEPLQQRVGDPARLMAGEPRWKPQQPALPAQLAGKIILVLGSFLRRPVRAATADGAPETFEFPLQPVSFPPVPPGMAFLEQRLHRTDRIGFTPP
jgi:hypothetical protein